MNGIILSEMNKKHISFSSICPYFFASLISLLIASLIFIPSRAENTVHQLVGGWSAPVNLSNSETDSINPAIAADPAGGVHVVWSELTDEEHSYINYAGLVDGYWTPANEIITSPGSATASYPSLACDSQGMLHLVWKGDANLLYSHAFALEAGSAKSWSEPQALEYVQNYIDMPNLAVDNQDQLHLAFAIQIGDKSGVYYSRTLDAEHHWSDPRTVYPNLVSERMVSKARIMVTKDGKLHVVWVEQNYPETYPPIGIRYSRSEDGGASWSDPVSLADGPYDDPEIIENEAGETHVVWSGTSTDRYKFHRWSADGGLTWSGMYRNTEIGGIAGWPALVEDSLGRLYWVMVGDIYSMETEGPKDALYAAVYEQGAWSPGIEVYRENVQEQNIGTVSGVIVGGDKLHAVVSSPVRTSSEAYQMDILYFFSALESPGSSLTPLAKPNRSESLIPPTAIVQSSEVTQLPDNLRGNLLPNSQDVFAQNSKIAILAGFIPVVLILSTIFLRLLLKKNKK